MAKPKGDEFEGWESWPLFRNTTPVHALQKEDGSYLVHGPRGDSWEVNEHDFHLIYKPQTPNKS